MGGASAEWTLEELRKFWVAARDDSSGVLGTIDFAHHKIHESDAFVCQYDNTVTNVGEMTVIAFNTPDTARWIHLVVEYTATAEAAALLVEAPSIDVDEGTDLAIFNRDRNSARAAEVSSIETVPEVGKATSYNEAQAAGANITINAANTLARHHIGGGTGPHSTGGGQLIRDEFILKRNTQYALILEALNNDTGIQNIQASWYENVSLAA